MITIDRHRGSIYVSADNESEDPAVYKITVKAMYAASCVLVKSPGNLDAAAAAANAVVVAAGYPVTERK